MQVTNLKAFLANIEMTLKEFSEIVDVAPAYLSRVLNGKVIPGRRLARDIERATSGTIVLKTRVRKKDQKSQDSQDEQNYTIFV